MKKEMRRALLKRRAEMEATEVSAKSKMISQEVGGFLGDCKVIMVYIPHGNEVDIYPVIDSLLAQGKKVVAPICLDNGTMCPSLINSRADLAPGRYDILAPKYKRSVALEDIDAVIVPGVGFDRQGNRLGFGVGYYDRFLAGLRPQTKKLAVCYDFQIVDNLPVDPWDFPADVVITEKKVYKK